jgi:hypothetical protein
MFLPRGWLKRPVPRMIYRTLESSELFDANWYRRTQLSHLEKLVDPLWHYLDVGWKKGLNPSPHFDTRYYLRHHPDVQDLGLNPLFHYLRYGIGEQRHPVQTSLRALHSLTGPLAPLRLLSTPEGAPPRITVVLDDFTPRDTGLPYARVLITALAMAGQSQTRLRVLDRMSFTDDLNLGDISRLSATAPPLGFEYKAVGVHNHNHDLPVYPSEIFLATSWSSACSLLSCMAPENVRYLKCDDELRFYGDSDQGSQAAFITSQLADSTIHLDPIVSGKDAKTKDPAPVVRWSATWSGSVRPSTLEAKQKIAIVVDLDTQVTGQRVGLTLEALTAAVGAGIVSAADHDIIVLSNDTTPFSLLASINPRIVNPSQVSDLIEVARDCDVYISLARPYSLGVTEHAILAMGASVISRYRGPKPSAGQLIFVEADKASIAGGIQEALSRTDGVERRERFTVSAEISGAW